nr:RHS repeat-associated core domain-containing protein [bacterium]
DGSFTGVGYYALYYDSYIQTLISGGLNGGYGTEYDDCDPNAANGQKHYDNADEHQKSKEPVDLVTGFYLNAESDLDVGRGDFPFRLPFTRSYSSGDRGHDAGLGYGWTSNWTASSQRASDGFPVLGCRTALDAVPAIAEIFVACDLLSNGLTLEPVVATTLMHRWLVEQLLDNVVTVRVMDHTWQFTKLPDGSWVNPGDNRTMLSVNPDGSTAMTSDTGTVFSFDTGGRLTGIADANGNTVTLTYSGDLLTGIANDMTRSLAFTYTGDNRIETVTDGNGRTVTFTYDGDGNLTHATDPESNVTEYVYDLPGRMTHIHAPSDPFNPWVYNEYDVLDRVIRQTDVMGNVYEFYYGGNRIEEMDPRTHCHVLYLDTNGRVVEAVDQLGLSTIFEYDGLNRIRRVEHPEGDGQEFEYDGMFRNVSTLRFTPKTGSSAPAREYTFTYDPVTRRRLTATDPQGDTTTYTYDAAGNMDLIELPEIQSVTPVYDFDVNSRGQVTRIENPEGQVMTFAYDPVTGDPENAVADAGGLNQTLAFDYNAVGTLMTVTDPMGHPWIYTYDANRRLTGITAPPPFGYQTVLGYSPDGNIQSISVETGVPADPWQTITVDYDLNSRLTHITDDENRTISLEFDDRRDIWKVYDELYQNTEALYDARGNAWRMLDEASVVREEHGYSDNGRKASVTDAATNTTQYTYDDFDRLLRKNYPDMSFIEYTYDDSGYLTGVTTRTGDTVTLGYNDMAQLTSKTYPDASQITYEYDLLGQMTAVENAWGAIEYQYDNLNRLITTTLPGPRVFSYQYDLNNNLTRITYPDGYYVTYEYDALNRLERLYENGATLLVTYGYDSLSRRISATFASGVTENYTWDGSDRVLTMSYSFTGDAVQFEYDYESDGDIRRVDVDNPVFEYSPAAAAVDTFTVNALNQYAAVNGVPYTYTAGGCLQSDTVWSYGYDYENLPVSADNGTDSVIYAYDGLKRRVSRTVNGVETRFLYDSFNLREIRDGGGALQVRYIYEPGLDGLVLMKTGGVDYFCHRDRLGSIIALSDATGNTVETYTYSPFGTPAAPSALGNVLMYCGSVYDPDTGLHYMRARYYSPALGRFITPDPLGFYGGGLNVYTYALNNPLRFNDRLGLYSNIGGGYLDNYNDMIADMYETDTTESRARAKELETIRNSLEQYGRWMESKVDKSGNCVRTWILYLENGFYEAVRNLTYYDVREVAGGYNSNTNTYGHFGIAVTPKNCTDFDKAIAIYDPIGHSYWNPGGQYDGADRQWDENAWRNPSTWKDTVLPYCYFSGGVDMGNNANLLHKPVVPGNEDLSKTYKLPDNYLEIYDMYLTQ